MDRFCGSRPDSVDRRVAVAVMGSDSAVCLSQVEEESNVSLRELRRHVRALQDGRPMPALQSVGKRTVPGLQVYGPRKRIHQQQRQLSEMRGQSVDSRIRGILRLFRGHGGFCRSGRAGGSDATRVQRPRTCADVSRQVPDRGVLPFWSRPRCHCLPLPRSRMGGSGSTASCRQKLQTLAAQTVESDRVKLTAGRSMHGAFWTWTRPALNPVLKTAPLVAQSHGGPCSHSLSSLSLHS